MLGSQISSKMTPVRAIWNNTDYVLLNSNVFLHKKNFFILSVAESLTIILPGRIELTGTTKWYVIMKFLK